jgi:hypothetical protein
MKMFENFSSFETMKKGIIDTVNSASNFSFDQDNEDSLIFSTRENGDVGDEEASDIDVKAGFKLKKDILANHDVVVDLEVVDEWVILTVGEKKEHVDRYRYVFKKDIDGSGFSATFEDMDSLIEKYGDWIEVDWGEIKEKLNKIDDFPRDTFTGWHRSYPMIISEAGTEGNKWGYNFFIIKMKKMVIKK